MRALSFSPRFSKPALGVVGRLALRLGVAQEQQPLHATW